MAMRKKNATSATAVHQRDPGLSALEALWAHHHAELRDPHEIVSQWQWSAQIDPTLLEHRVQGRWWECLEQAGVNVKVVAVNTINRQGKRKRTRAGWGRRKATKRALVRLADGDRIEAFGGPVS